MISGRDNALDTGFAALPRPRKIAVEHLTQTGFAALNGAEKIGAVFIPLDIHRRRFAVDQPAPIRNVVSTVRAIPLQAA